MARSLEQIQDGKKVGDLRKEAASLYVKYAEKHPLLFIGAEGKEYSKGLIKSHGRLNDCINYISMVEVFLETVDTVEPVQAVVEPVKSVETVDTVEPVKSVVETVKVASADETPDYTNSEQEKIAIAKQLYYSKAKENGLTGLREYHLMLCQQDKFFLPDFAILVARTRVIIEEYANSKSFEGKAHPGSIQKIRLEIIRFIEGFVNADKASFDHPKGITLLESYQAFDDAVRGAFKDIGALKHQLNQKMNKAGEIDVRAIKVLPFIEWAMEVVSNLPALPSGNASEDRSNGAKWKEIAIAVMLLTGRRQSEVLSSGIFNYVDESTVVFEGQLKRHVEELVQAEKIPVLGKAARQVVDAIEWLAVYQKRTIPQERVPKAIQDAAKKSHDKCSRYIAEVMETLSKCCLITNNKQWIVVEGGKEVNKFKGHLCRQIYAQVCEGLFNDPNETKKRAFINKILLESRDASVPYDRDINVTDINEVKAICGKL